MKPKAVIPREQALQDVEEALAHDVIESSSQAAALGFIDALEEAYAHLACYPSSGSLRYAHELDWPDLRCWPLRQFPYLVFYLDRPDCVDVWRVLHAERDIPARMDDISL